jgi:hypothetical protein
MFGHMPSKRKQGAQTPVSERGREISATPRLPRYRRDRQYPINVQGPACNVTHFESRITHLFTQQEIQLNTVKHG